MNKEMKYIDQLEKEIEEIRFERDKFKSAYIEWSDKTDWIQDTCKGHEIGLHRADVLRNRINLLEKEHSEVVELAQRYARSRLMPDDTAELYDLAIGEYARIVKGD